MVLALFTIFYSFMNFAIKDEAMTQDFAHSCSLPPDHFSFPDSLDL